MGYTGAAGRRGETMARDEQITRCSICGREPVGEDYPRRVCPRCDALALNDAGRPPLVAPDGSAGDNPVFIEGRQCWREYARGGWATMLDADNCRDYREFCRRNGLPDPP